MSNGYEIVDFVRDVLAKRFSGDPHKIKVNEDDSTKINFACHY